MPPTYTFLPQTALSSRHTSTAIFISTRVYVDAPFNSLTAMLGGEAQNKRIGCRKS